MKTQDITISTNTQQAINDLALLTIKVIEAHEAENNCIALNQNIEFKEAVKQKVKLNHLYDQSMKKFLEMHKKRFKRRHNFDLSKLLDAQKNLKSAINTNISLLGSIVEKSEAVIKETMSA